MAPDTHPVSFTGSFGAELAARLDLPASAPRAFAVFAHCFICTKDTPASRAICAALAEEGIATLRFDLTGHGESQGDLTKTSFMTAVDDILAAAAWLTEAHEAPRLLVGHGFGGTAARVASARIPSLVALAAVNAAADPAHMLGVLRTEFGRLLPSGEIEVELAGKPVRLPKRFQEEFEGLSRVEDMAPFPGALLLLHAPADFVVGLEHARRLFDAAVHPKSFIALDGADHLLSREEDAAYAAHMIAHWAARYLPRPGS